MRIDHHSYQLSYKDNYGTVGPGSIREGMLLRLTFDDGLVGYCDCHPWVELGDWPLSKQLSALRTHQKTPLLECSFRFARLDAEARHEQRSLFIGLEIPPSHRLVSLSDNLAALTIEGFTRFKLKIGKDPEREISTMNVWVKSNPGVKLRLDFNERLTRDDFLGYWTKIPLTLRECIDYLEDPYFYEPEIWQKDQQELGVSFAADHSAVKALQFPKSARVIVHKPAVEVLSQKLDETTQLVITTYLDHPFGQMCAAYTAALLKVQYPRQVGYCGLLSHECYQSDPFIDSVHAVGVHLSPPGGTGFGFNNLLEGLQWQSL